MLKENAPGTLSSIFDGDGFFYPRGTNVLQEFLSLSDKIFGIPKTKIREHLHCKNHK